MNSEDKVKLPPVHQIGIVVRDIEKAVEHYTSTFGIGPFSIIDVDMEGAILRGKPISTKIKAGFAQSGPLQIEFIQPVEGENLYTEFLATEGEGLHHLAFQVEDLDAVLAEFAKVGIEPILHHNIGGFAFAYLNTDKVGGVLIELLCSPRGES